MDKIYAFVDESGNSGFDFTKKDVSTHFIISAILIKENDLDKVKKDINDIRKKYFQTGEIKSSKISKNHKKRVSILQELLNCDFKIFSVIIDKRKIYQESGLKYKKSFYKFINNIIYNELRRNFIDLVICADEMGGNEYMKSFGEYVRKQSNLLNFLGTKEFYFEDSKNNILIQIADFISGTLSFMFEDTKKDLTIPNYINIMSKSINAIENWPKDIETYKYCLNGINNKYDEKIAEISYKQSQNFILSNKYKTDEETILQIIVLKYLCFRFINNDKRNYISTKEILNNLNYSTGKQFKTHYFRSRIIAKLRDSGVLIASSSKGYKIPSTQEQLYDYINHGTTVIMPMLLRLKTCRDVVKKSTLGEIDLFEHTEYKELNKFFD